MALLWPAFISVALKIISVSIETKRKQKDQVNLIEGKKVVCVVVM